MIIDKFEEQVRKHPNHIAVKTVKGKLTYQELNDYANAVAREIIHKRDVITLAGRVLQESLSLTASTETAALLFERGSDMIVGKFGALKAAKVYVPLDPDYPSKLLTYMLENSEADLIITNDENVALAHKLIQESNREAEIINISKIMIRDFEEFISPKYEGHELAYILYTSGSTGRPKGVMQSHRNVLHFAECYGSAIKITPEDRVTLMSSFSHDGGIGDIYVTLLNGATLYPLDIKFGVPVNELSDWLKAEQISIWHSVPTLYRHFINTITKNDEFPALRFIAVGGESVLPHDVKQYQNFFPAAKFAILYGQSESSINSIQIYTANCQVEEITLGKPVRGTEIVVVNENRKEVAPLGTGEIIILSNHVALGYWQDELKSQEVFREIPGIGRTYWTGDLGKLLLDGNIEIIGRKDFQVKIRGFRIELSGIENHLLELDMVREAAVMAYEDKENSDEKYLCAYIVLEEEEKVNQVCEQNEAFSRDSLDKLREHLAANLPDYMIPSHFVRMDKFPLMPNGKVNRKALPAPDVNPRSVYVAPKNKMEEILSQIWSEVLGREKVGINDNFFELGGHSLKATDLASKIHKELDVKLPLKELFAQPTISGISEYLAVAKKSEYVAIEPAAEKEYYEVSSAQKRIWLLHQLDQGSTAYNMPEVLILEGSLDKQRLEEAFIALIERHELLRTTFNMVGDLIIQRVNKAWDVEFEVEYSRGKEEDIEAFIKDFIRPFDLKQAPLLRVGLIKVNANRHYLLFDMHHIISDGTAITILMQDFMMLYNGGELEEQRIGYKDFSEWQNAYLKSEAMKKQENYWLEQFAEAVPPLKFPLDYARPPVQSFAGGSVEFKIKQKLTTQLNSFARETGTTLYMVLSSAVSILLSKYTGQVDITLGSPIAGRVHADLEGIIGMFVNTLVMRSYPEKDKTYQEFLKEVKETSLMAYENQDYQFEELVEKLNLRRDQSRNPLFDVMFVLQNMEVKELAIEGIKLTKYKRDQRSSKFDLSFTAMDTGEEILFDIEYCRDLFKRETIERLSVHLQNLIEKIITNKEILLGDIEILSEEETYKILYKFNDTAVVYPIERTVVELFEEQVEKTPDHIAIVFEDEEITYKELNAKANILAHKLRGLGIGTDDYVGIIAERSIQMIIGIYGIIKAGGAYVPLDPTYPVERIQYMLADSSPKVVLAYHSGEENIRNEKFTVGSNCSLIDLSEDSVWEGVTENPTHINQAENLLYCIYTSGTTGKPKGVMIEHCSIVNLTINFLRPLYEKYHVKKSLFNSSYVFDVSIENIIGALTSGVSIFIAAENVRLDAQKLCRYICEKNIDILECTPSHLKILSTVDFKEMPLKVALVGGEKVGADVVALFGKSFALYNIYGPTECSVDSTWYLCSNDVENIYENRIPIGRPIPNLKVYILDQKRLCGIGIIGEICIAGDGLARGYLNQPELTKEKFIDNPFGEGKLYLTGDLGRWLSDGNIEYLGRIDEQVKIRGLRIELGEIESALRKIEAINDCAVISRSQRSRNQKAEVGGQKRLDDLVDEGEQAIHAYLVADTALDISQIRDVLAQSLPDYMIPAYMTQIESIPLTRNGKLDKRALPEIEMRTEREYLAPRTEMEQQLCAIFADVLDIRKVGVKDSFFELGGHSLKATKLVNRIESKMGVRIPLKEVFLNPTVEGLVAHVREVEGIEYNPIPKAEEKEYYEMSSAQRRIYLIGQMNPEAVTYNMPQYLKLIGDVCPEKIESALQELVNRHEILRTAFMMIEGEPVQCIREGVDVDFEYVSEGGQDEEQLMLDFIKPFDLGIASQLRAKVINMDGYHLLMFDMHHIISDGMSITTLINEFTDLYNGKELEPIIHQFKDYSEWMRVRDLSHQKDYWIQQFNNEIPMLDLPLDYIRPKEQSFEGATISLETGKELGDKIKELARQTATTDYMIFLASIMVLLGTYANQEDVVIGTPISGRTHKDTEAMLGMFVNTLAMRGHPEREKSFERLLEEVKQGSLKAFEFQEYPFEELVENVDIKRDLSRNPLFDVMLVFQNNEGSEGRMNDIFSEYTGVVRQVAKFDLTFSIWEIDGNYGIALEYCSALFKQETMTRMLEHYVELLKNLLARPAAKLKEVRMISESCQRKILEEFNDTTTNYPQDKTVMELFEEQVEKIPDHIAVVFGEEQLTYRELNKKANALAHKLRKLGIERDDYVGIMAERSNEMIIGIYGIIKSGAAYIPIDQTYPMERIQYMLEDSRPKVILTYRAKGEQLASKDWWSSLAVPIIDLGEESIWEGITGNPTHINQAEDLLYCIYTSGTTGKPKGVMVTHRSVLNLVQWQRINGNYTETTTVLQNFNYIFDGSVWEIFPALLSGCTLEVMPEVGHHDLKKMLKLLSGKQVTMTPTMFRMLIDYAEEHQLLAELNSFERLYLAGELLPNDLIARYKAIFGNKIEKTFNAYGPTEATVCATAYQFNQNHDRVLIGKPIGNVQVYIMKANMLCGIGISGELCIAGDGLARGYLNLPELTKEKFIDNPFGEGKLYLTGDLARWLQDGNVEYLGRIDEQVKIRGFRIELSEIESAISELEEVKECAVIVRENSDGEQAISAYLLSDNELNFSQIRDNLMKILPDYMIPSYFTQIESIPLTRNGKLDKRSLPKIETRIGREYVLPRTEIEKKLCTIFEEILGVEMVGIKDSFFELGGHSLRATRLINRVESEMGAKIPLKEVFSNPTVESLTVLIKEVEGIEYIPIPKAEAKEYYEMSSAQRRIYLIGQMDPEAVTYNMPQYLKLTGDVHPEKIENALQELINRHEILRTAFMMKDGEPMQCIWERVDVNFEYVRVTEQKAQQLMLEFVKPFDLGQPSQLRARVINMNSYHLLMLDMHHIIGDEMSMMILINEFTDLYNGKKLEVLSHQFKDYSEWMRARNLSSQRDYWIHEFSDEIPVLDLPLDYIRPKEQSFAGATISLETCKELGNKIKELTGQTATTEYMVFLASTMIFLGIYSNQEDVVIGSPISGRIHKDTEQMLGMFVNTLAMRGRPEKEKTFESLLEEVKQSSLKAYENQEYPFEELVENVAIRRDLSRNPLFDVMLVLHNNEKSEKRMNDVLSEYTGVSSLVAKFDLTFHIREIAGSYKISLEYSTALFKEETVVRMLEHYVELIWNLLERPTVELKKISMITKAEEHLIMEEFNNTNVEYPRKKTLVILFEEQVGKTPDRVAVVFEEKELTYQELNEKANAVAHKLRDLGVGVDDYVAIMTERSIEMIIGIYGIIKAGGAYVPIDLTYPTSRVHYMLEDCRPKALLTNQDQLKIETEIPIINLTDPDLYHGKTQNPERVNHVDDLICLLYTSGTTGRPKGVMMKYRTILNSLHWMLRNYPINEKDVILLKTNYVFDAITSELFWWMMVGGKVVLLEPGVEKDPFAIVELITKHQVTMVNFVPTMFSAFLATVEERPEYIQKVSSLKYVVAAGEALSSNLVMRCYHIFPKTSTKLINVYGPTEGFYVSYYDCDGNESFIPIGKPISNTKIYIMNGDVLCGIGVPGELCSAGDGLARGYVNQPQLTKDKFIDNPYGAGKLYRTGDLARWLPDGKLEYLGRIDEQVKIRGLRVELGEIESALRKSEAINDCAVIVKEDKYGEKAINAYLVSDQELNVSQLSDSLAKSLPDYMIPAYMMQIDAIPITRNGKLDRRALPEIEMGRSKAYVPPKTAVEETLCIVFQEILGVNQVGIKDHFFELGGHSLRAVRLVNLLEAETGVRIPLKEVFREPTVEGLAELVQAAEGSSYIPISKAEAKEYYAMSSAQKRIYVIGQMDPEAVTYNLPQYLKLTGTVHPKKIESVLQELVNRHEILRTAFMIKDGEPVQRIHEQVAVNFEYAGSRGQKSEVGGQNTGIQRTIAEMISEFVRPFDLSQPSQLRVKLLNRGSDHLLMFDMHHIISDGMSMTTLINEFMTLYNGKVLEPMTHQFKDYSEWMRSRDLSDQKDYWVGEFSDEIPILDLPLDYVRPKERSSCGAMTTIETGKELGGQIKEKARQTGSTEYMVFLASVMVLLGIYANQEDVVIGSPISGRTHKDTEAMLGMFVNTLAMRGKPERNKSFDRLLEEVKASSLKAFENQEYPFEELVEHVDVRRDLSRNPLFDVMLVLQNNEASALKMDGVGATYTGVGSSVARFDLTFTIWEDDGNFRIDLGYCTALFKEETARLMLEHYLELIQNLIAKSAAPLKEISMLTKNEQQMILVEFNDTYAEYPRNKTVHQLFEEQVAQTPDHVALVFGEETMTYTELNMKANQLARILRAKGMKPDEIVGIMVERSPEMIIGILGILKAGGAYLPIDTEHPEDRIKFMMEDSGAKIQLTQSWLRERVAFVGEQIILDEAELLAVKDERNAENLEIVNNPNDLAYVMYTSGTTGKPKGVMIEHKNVVNFITGQINRYRINESDRVVQFSPFYFDPSAEQIFTALLSGAALYLIKEELLLDIHQFGIFMEANKITHIKAVPTFLEKLDLSRLRYLRRIISGGEQCPISLARRMSEKFEAYNVYGPTEATINASAYLIKPEQIGARVPIGGPLTNYQMYIGNLSNDQQIEPTIMPIGVPGELLIGGDGVARGYLNHPDLTREKFIPNPFIPGERLYRTGDLARFLPDGNVEYLGRVDEQVKIRGFRIELAEIEHVLRTLEEIKDCVVITKADSKEELAIYAYVISDIKVSPSAIRDRLVKQLPHYMIPSYMTQIERIPLTRNGKLDKRALPEIEVRTEAEYVPPRTEVEARLCALFEEILAVQPIGVKDSFFELGGDSIKAIRIVSKLREMNYTVSIKEIMQGRTIEQIALSVKEGTEATLYEQGEVVGIVEATPIIKEFASRGLAKPNHYNQAVMLSVGKVKSDEIKAILTALVIHHDMLRAVYRNQTLEILDSKTSSLFDFYEFDFKEVEDAKNLVELQCTEIQGSINLEVGPLVKAALFQVKEGSFLMLCIHHLVIDGVSWRILEQDFHTVLRQVVMKEEVKLPRKTASFKEWSELLQEYKDSSTTFVGKKYWKKIATKLNDARFLYPARQSTLKQNQTVSMVLSASETDRLVSQSNRTFNTETSELLLSALAAAVNKLTGQCQIAINLERHGREELHKRIDIDRTIGWFTSKSPVILTKKAEWKDTIVENKNTLRLIPNNGILYGLMSFEKEVNVDEIGFNYHGNVGGSDDLVASYSAGLSMAEENHLSTAISFDGALVDRRISFTVSYDSYRYSKDGIEKLVEYFKESLLELVAYCINYGDIVLTSSDFDERLESDDFDEILMDLI